MHFRPHPDRTKPHNTKPLTKNPTCKIAGTIAVLWRRFLKAFESVCKRRMWNTGGLKLKHGLMWVEICVFSRAGQQKKLTFRERRCFSMKNWTIAFIFHITDPVLSTGSDKTKIKPLGIIIKEIQADSQGIREQGAETRISWEPACTYLTNCHVILILGFPKPAIEVNSVMCKNPSILSGISWRNNDVFGISTFFADQPYQK